MDADEERRVLTRTELIAQARRVLNCSDNPTLRALGLAQQPQAGEMIERSIAELFERGWPVGEERLSVTDMGWMLFNSSYLTVPGWVVAVITCQGGQLFGLEWLTRRATHLRGASHVNSRGGQM